MMIRANDALPSPELNTNVPAILERLRSPGTRHRVEIVYASYPRGVKAGELERNDATLSRDSASGLDPVGSGSGASQIQLGLGRGTQSRSRNEEGDSAPVKEGGETERWREVVSKANRIWVLDSSFNPPTLAHRALADIALQSKRGAQAHPSSPDWLLLLLSVRNADKQLKPGDATFEQRVEMMRVMAEELALEQKEALEREQKEEKTKQSDRGDGASDATNDAATPPGTRWHWGDMGIAVGVIDEPTFVGKSRVLRNLTTPSSKSSTSVDNATAHGVNSGLRPTTMTSSARFESTHSSLSSGEKAPLSPSGDHELMQPSHLARGSGLGGDDPMTSGAGSAPQISAIAVPGPSLAPEGIGSAGGGRRPRLFFLLGWDTIIRVFSPEYYEKSETKMREALEAFLGNPERAGGDGSVLVCARRGGHVQDEERSFLSREGVREWARCLKIVDIPEDVRGLSSTAVRASMTGRDEGAAVSEVGEARAAGDMTLPRIGMYIRRHGLYQTP